ncbi:DUF7530 family protein [Halocalculus aciditolerans]|uniref:Uncharacterized protein n=1 Tax=Halocalculus aciditolerans TaxID=1383812 RepID=A0A830F6S6_9EURY|nr:hypothetical protein [Halocalculus aciditolerans]GGL46507.1 hypothetical protein GCM10009039_01040 [Halocalculus aciditolerans]
MTAPESLDVPRAAWAYESILDALPGVSVPPWVAVGGHFAGFEALVLLGAWLDGRWAAVLPATVVVAVAAAGSAFTFDIAARVRERDPPDWYVSRLFASNVEFLFAVTAYAVFLTAALTRDPGLVGDFAGGYPLPTFVALVVAWDVSYRIAAGWWAAVLSLYRTLRDPSTARRFRGVDARIAAFALAQLALVPVVHAPGRLWLSLAICGHVLAVLAVLATAEVVGRVSSDSAS